MNRPAPPPLSSEPAARGARGAGALGALVAFTLAGAIDGLVAFARTPAPSRAPALLAWCVVHCAGVLAALGLVVAAAQEVFLRAAVRRPALRAMGAWLLAGPRRWWAPDERAALGLSAGIAGFAVGVGGVVAVVAHVTRTFHSRALMVAPIALAVPGGVALAAVAGVVASWPLSALLRRAGRLASVGSVATFTALAAAVPGVHVFASHRDAVAALDPWAFALAGALLAADLAVVAALLVRARRPGPSPRRGLVPSAALAAAVACTLLAVVPARGLGRRQAVMIAIASRSLLARPAVGPLQRALDRDRDGHGVLFGGGDCDDRNPRIYPGAPETPGNGVDESCSGRDAPARVRSARAAPARGAETVAERPPSVLFVSIDAVRPDHTTVYGYHRPTTPNLARFAARAARFTSAYAVAPGSLRSFASTFTGRYPGDVAWGRGVDPRYPAVADDNVTLAEELRAAGYATAAFTNTSYFSGTPGFYQGFDVVQDPREFKDDAAPIVRGAVEWIERPRTRPFFAWVHLIDPHAPYGEHNWPQEFGRTELDRYDGEIARADAFAARLLDAADRIERRGDPVLVVVFSDHGEGFNEHGSRFHYYDVHEEVIRVALLVRGPGVAPGNRRALTALFDLHATVLEFARQPVAASTPSRSLVPVLLGRHGGAPPDWRAEVYADAAEYGGGAPTSMALVAPPWKIAFDATRSVWELYNLELDPGEQNNLYDDDPARAAELRARLFDVDARR